MATMSKLEIPAFYRFVRHILKDKVLNKNRLGFRGSKKRYSVWRAEYNQKWENVYKDKVVQVCKIYGLNLADELVFHKRTPWEKTYESLREQGYDLRYAKKSIDKTRED